MIQPIPSDRSQRRTRVAAYIRVSSQLTTQEESFETQRDYYRTLIEGESLWDLVDIYGDRVSGTKARNRPEFQRMIADACEGKIDLILCKSISRWGRNTADALETVRTLTGRGVALIFEQEGIDTRDANQVMKLNLVAAIAQSESENISENMKWVYRERARMGIYVPRRGRFYGYDTSEHTFEPDENAATVQMIFSMYAEGARLKDIVERLEGRTSRGKEWSPQTVRYMLQNEIYVGDVRFGKKVSRNVITGEVDELQAEGYVKDHHTPLIDRETWERVQARIKKQRNR